jgi:anti-anti-sigma factor
MRVERSASLTYVELLGELDLSYEDRFGDAVDTVQSGLLVLDLGGLTFIDSAGIRVILRTWHRSREDGFALEIVGARDQVAKVFRIAGLDGVLPLVDQISLNGRSQHSNDH